MKRESNPSPKKKWARSKLIILTRGRPDEGVLAACKASWYATGPAIVAAGCNGAPPGVCLLCAVNSGS
jgi:hypothetical protein